MKKLIKRFFKFIACIFVLAIVIILTLPLWIGPVATTVANKIVPEKVGAEFNLGEFALNPYTGKIHVGKMTLENPPEFKKENCVDLRDLDIDIDIATVASQKIHIREIVLDGLTIATTPTGDNFKAIAKNASGTNEVATAETEKGDESVASEEKRVVIDRVILKNIVVKYGLLPIPIPTLELTDIGADKPEGASFLDVSLALYDAVLKSMGAITDLGKGLFGAGADATTKTIDAAADATSATINKASEAAEATVQSIKDLKNIFKRKKAK